MIEKRDLSQLKQYIQSSVGERVRLSSNKGKRKSFVREGVIENSYPSLFTIRFQNEYDMTRRLSYSYTDVLTKGVEILVYRDEEKRQAVV